jgi:hypothetical protein
MTFVYVLQKKKGLLFHLETFNANPELSAVLWIVHFLNNTGFMNKVPE